MWGLVRRCLLTAVRKLNDAKLYASFVVKFLGLAALIKNKTSNSFKTKK